jgi:DNA-binding NtrC family response regulator
MQARLVVASGRDLEREVAAGRFRSDLYYRLNVVGFHLPPLRERPASVVEAIARHFIAQFAPRAGGRVRDLSPAALRALQGHDWPGNVRELRNAVERAVALCPGDVIEVEDLPPALTATPPGADAPGSPDADAPPTGAISLARNKDQAEAACIVAALERHNNNRLRAAAELGISRMTLYKKLHRYGLIADEGA